MTHVTEPNDERAGEVHERVPRCCESKEQSDSCREPSEVRKKCKLQMRGEQAAFRREPAALQARGKRKTFLHF